MILGAGLSTRLRPLTDQTPKPFLPFWNLKLLDLSALYLKEFGINSASINVHHGRDIFLKELQASQPIQLKPFVEKNILGTGGGIQNMQSFIKDEDFVVVNCDFITNVDLRKAFEFHQSKKALATMILIENPKAKKYGHVGINSKDQIVSFPFGTFSAKPTKSGLFSGIHIFHSSIFQEMPKKKIFDINSNVYASLLKKKAPIYGYLTKDFWFDVGEIKLYAEAQFALLKNPFSWMLPLLKEFDQPQPQVFISKNVKLTNDVQFKGPVLISDGVQIGSDCILGPNVVVSAKAKIGKGSGV